MKNVKNVIFLGYLIAVLGVLAYIFKPPIAIIGICSSIGILELVSKTFFTFDQSDKKEMIWFKIIVMLLINGFAILALLLAQGYDTDPGGFNAVTISGLKMIFWMIFLFVMGMNVYILYSYFFEKKEKSLI